MKSNKKTETCECGKYPIERYQFSINSEVEVWACGTLCAMRIGDRVIKKGK